METNTLDTISKGKWQWQSNLDPWSKAEPPQWESYPLDHNYLIEKAYYDGQKEVDLGDYLVYPLKKVQKKKGNPQAQRPVRRIDWIEDEELNNRSARYFESELPKTINRIFGGLGDFIRFFSRRNKGILEFTIHFQELEKSNNLDILNLKIVPEVLRCLEGVLLKSSEQKLTDPSLTEFKKKMLLKARGKIQELILSFRKTFSNLEEFDGQILKAYTMNTDLYQDLNKYLRNENWMEVDKLLPYAFCLCKAFFNPNLRKESLGQQEEQASRILYRGTAFDEFSRNFYDRSKIQYFSWNAVTSTTTNKEKAEEFMHSSIDMSKKKYPVMFHIEIPDSMESEEYSRWLDIHQYSALPAEDEVILPPGSVFELAEVFTDQDSKTTIKIKLMSKVQMLAHKGLMMQGTLQSQIMTEKEGKIMSLEGEELFQALMTLAGNKLIEEIEFSSCLFDEIRLKEMLQILLTIERAKSIKFVSCTYEGNKELTIEKLECSGITKIEVIETDDFFQLICNESLGEIYWTSLRELRLDVHNKQNIQDEDLISMVSQGLKYLTHLTSLNIVLGGCELITDKGVSILAEGLSYLSGLTSLALNFAGLEQLTDKGMASLELKNLVELKSFTLNLDSCQVTEKGVEILARQISRSQLNDLNIDFGGCSQITDEALRILASEGINSLNQLESLAFNFVKCQQITDNGVFILASEGLKNLTKIKDLNLDFEWCPEITDEGVVSLAENGLKFLERLSSLSLNFRTCEKITDRAIESLAFCLEEYHIQLTSLTLYFGQCKAITDKGMASLVHNGLKNLISLTSLSLTFMECEITDQSMKSLVCLNTLNQLTSLTLTFTWCEQITLEGVEVLMFQGLVKLTQLTSLDMNFSFFDVANNKKMRTLVSHLPKNLVLLNFLKLNDNVLRPVSKVQSEFYEENRIRFVREISDDEESDSFEFSNEPKEDLTEEFFCIIASEAEKGQGSNIFHKFSHLTSLDLEFQGQRGIQIRPDELQNRIPDMQECAAQGKSFHYDLRKPDLIRNLTDRGVGILAKGLRYLTQLTSLNIGFPSCYKLTEAGVADFARNGLKYLSALTHLSLDFSKGSEITDECLEILGFLGLKSLQNLTSLVLSFNDCPQITDKGIDDLACFGLRYLLQLNSLALDLSGCHKITIGGVGGLAWSGLKSLGQLKSLSLNFCSCSEITHEGLRNLAFKGLKYLHQLKSLRISLEWCSQITDREIIDLADGLGHLSELRSLNLNFSECGKITNEGIDALITKGLQNLIQLKSLILDISFNHRITDKGINKLIRRGVGKLPRLAFLDLLIQDCANISDFTVQNTSKILHYFGFENFSYEDDWTDETDSESE